MGKGQDWERALSRILSLWITSGRSNRVLWGDVSYLWGDCSGLRGDCSELKGDCSGLVGDVSGLRGNCTDIEGDLDEIDISKEQRQKGINIEDLVGAEE